MSKFQLTLLIVFGAFIVIAVLAFSLVRSTGKARISLTVWGEISETEMRQVLIDSKQSTEKDISFTYIEKTPEEFDRDFTEALAEGKGPDLVIIPHDKLWRERNKLMLITQETLKPADYLSTFIDEAEVFMTNTGTYALPLVVDPMVLYYNRDMLSSAAFIRPPTYWDEIYGYAEKLTKKDPAGNITTSAIALGEARNIPHAKDILSLLILQAGSPVTRFESGILRAMLTYNPGLPLLPTSAALDFYTQFGNPTKPFYSWNRSLLPADTAFVSGDAAMYVGFASEYHLLKAKNPTLPLGVAPVPQSRVSEKNMTFGRMYGVAIVRSSSNRNGAYSGALRLVASDISGLLAESLFLPPVRRNLLEKRPSDPILSVFYDSAVRAKGWIDPNAAGSRAIFTTMIESVTSGRARTNEAVGQGQRELEALIQR